MWVFVFLSSIGSGGTYLGVLLWLAGGGIPKVVPEQIVGIFTFSYFMSSITSSLFAGLLVDRINLRIIVPLSSLLSAGTCVWFCLKIQSESTQVRDIVFYCIFVGTLESIFILGFDKFLGLRFSGQCLSKELVIQQAIKSLRNIISPISISFFYFVGKTILDSPGAGELSLQLILIFDALTFAVLSWILFRQNWNNITKAQHAPKKRIRLKIGQIITLLRSPKFSFLLGVAFWLNLILGSLSNLNLMIMSRLNSSIQNSNSHEYQVLIFFAGIGGIVGILLSKQIKAQSSKPQFEIFLLGSIASASLLLYTSNLFTLIIIAFFIFMCTIPLISLRLNFIWQTSVENSTKGVIFSIRKIVAQLGLPLGSLFSTYMIRFFQPSTIVAILTCLMAFYLLINFFLTSRSISQSQSS